jgi:hypothetical protein
VFLAAIAERDRHDRQPPVLDHADDPVVAEALR